MDGEEEIDLDRSLRKLLFDGLVSQIMFSLLTVSIISSYLASRNASPLLIGLVAATPYLSQIVQIPSAIFAETFSRKKLSLVSNAISRISLLGIAIAVLSASDLVIFILFFAIYNIFKEVSTTPWSSWMRDLIPDSIRGHYYSTRIAYGKLVALFAVLAFTVIFNLFGTATFPLLFATAFVAGMVSLYFINGIDDVKTVSRGRKSLREPLKNKNFLKLISGTSLWRFASELALPFYSVYIIAVLGYPVWIVIALASISQLSSTYFLRISGRIMDRFGNRPVLALSFTAFSIAAFLFTFTTMPERHLFTLPLLVVIYVLDGFYTSVPGIALMNAVAKISPRGSSASYYALNNVINSVFGAAGSLTGGIIASFFVSANFAVKIDIESSLGLLEVPALHFASYDFLFLISAAISIAAIKMLRLFDEENAKDEEAVKVEMKRAVITDIYSLMTAMHIPFPHAKNYAVNFVNQSGYSTLSLSYQPSYQLQFESIPSAPEDLNRGS